MKKAAFWGMIILNAVFVVLCVNNDITINGGYGLLVWAVFDAIFICSIFFHGKWEKTGIIGKVAMYGLAIGYGVAFYVACNRSCNSCAEMFLALFGVMGMLMLIDQTSDRVSQVEA